MPATSTHSTHKRIETRARQRYSVEDKLKAVSIIATYKGITLEAVNEIRTLFNTDIDVSTLHKWRKQYESQVIAANPDLAPQPIDVSKIVAETRQKLLSNLAQLVSKVSARQLQDDVIDKASLRDLSVTLGISTEKILLLAGRSPELDNQFQRLIQACIGTRYDPMTLLSAVIDNVEREKHQIFLNAENTVNNDDNA